MSYRPFATVALWILGAFTFLIYPLSAAAQTPGLVAAYAFNETSGTTVIDVSGNNNGTMGSTVTRIATGKFGGALVFNGTNTLVTIPNSASLQLTTGMTLEAWVNPSAATSAWRDVIYKGNDNYYLSATSTSSGKPAGGGTFGATTVETFGATILPVNTWTHLAVTYDGATLRLYVNGAQVSSLARTGNLLTSTNPLQIGGDSIYGQFFQGMIDEVRVYNVALTTAQIQTDMNTAIGATNTAPTISPIADKVTDEDTATGAIAFTVGDAETAAVSLTVSGSSSNTALVPNPNIAFGGSGANRTVTITPAANQNGTTTITVTVSDGQVSTPTSFLLTVNAVNDPPTIASIANQTTTAGTAVGPISFTVADIDTPLTSLTVSGSSSNQTLVPNGNIVFGGSGANRTVTITPAANQNGTATITVTVSDGQLSTPASFQLTVNQTNTPPTISPISAQATDEDVPTNAIAFTVGDGETAVGSLTVSGSSSNTALAPNGNIVFGGSGANRTVTITPAANQNGTATITVTVNDGQLSTPTSFLLTVNAVNDAPTITSIVNQTTISGTVVGPISFTVGDVDTPLASLTVSGSSDNATLVPNANIVFGGSGANRTVTVTPAQNQTGTATITVTVSDGQFNTPTSFQLTVNAFTTVTAFPSSTTILSGTLSSGTAASLTSDDNVYFAVNSTTSGTRTAAWYGSFTGVSKSLTTLRANYKGNNSRNCTQTIAILQWSTNAWVQLDSRTVGTTEVAVNNLLPTGTLADYVSGPSGSGEVRVRIQCQATQNLTNRGDVMSIVYDAPIVPNTAPTISPIADKVTDEDTATGAIAFTVGDAETAAVSLTVSGNSSNTALAPNANIVFGGSGVNRTVTITPAANQNGTATITVTVSDGQLPTSTSFLLTVNAVNDAPTIASIANQTTTAGTAVGPISFTVADIDTPLTSLTVSGSSSNQTLVPNGNIVFGGTGASRTVTVMPAANQTGVATIAVVVSDGQLSTPTSFQLTVNPPNTAPTISPIADQVTDEDTPTSAIAFTVGDGETAVGSLTVSGSSSNTALVPNGNIVFGGSGANRTVTITPAANQNGTATITVTVNDGQLSTPTSFLLTVNAVNDAPTIASIANQTTTAGTAVGPISFTVADIDTPLTSLTVSGSSSNTALVPNGNIVFGGSGANRTVTITPAANQNGTATITVTVSDGQFNTPTSFQLTVNATFAGLVAAYGLNETSGTTVTDVSGNNNTGTLGSGVTRTTAGKYGSALVFNGSSFVTIPSATSLNLTSAMTLEAWVNPSAATSAWRDVIYKGNDNYYLSATSTSSGKPAGGGTFGATTVETFGATILPVNTWTHLAVTYDGATLRLYVNGAQVSSLARTGNLLTSTNPLQIGGDSIYGQFFQGMIDEVRVYNRALSQAEIQTDMNTPVGGTPPLTAPSNLTAITFISGSQVNVSWTAPTVGTPTSYLLERCQGTGCSNFAQIATPTVSTYNDTAVTPNTSYSYRVRATDASGNLSAYSNVALAFTDTSLSISPRVAALTFTRTQQFTSNGSNPTWSVDGVQGGLASSGTITAAGLYSPPSSEGTHSVTVTDGSLSAAATVYVTNYPGTFTHHNDNFRTGRNLNETVLTPANVSATTFGKLFTYPLDGIAYASPLYVANVNIPGQGFHNVVYVATDHDTVYAFDADGLSGTPLWRESVIDPVAGVTTVPCGDAGPYCDMSPVIGITGTPVIDPTTGTLYVVAKTKEVSGTTTNYVQRLHALDITTGAEKFGGPVVLQASVPGVGTGSQGGRVAFVPLRQNQRPALLLSNGVVYIGFGGHDDQPPYHGWVLGYNATTLQQTLAFNATPNNEGAGIWQSGGGLAADAAGNVYFATGDGTFTVNTGGIDYGDSLVKINPTGAVLDYFTPHDELVLDQGDLDLCAGGVILLPDQPGLHPHLLIGAGKNGTVYVVDRDNMGHFNSNNDNNAVQTLPNIFPYGTPDPGNYSNPVYFNGTVYFSPVADTLQAFSLTNGLLSTAPTSQSSVIYPYPGGTMAISANGTTNGILWAIQRTAPGVLRAYDPANLANVLYDSEQAGSRDTLGTAAKFTPPIVVNGKVFVGSTSQLTVYGLLP